MANWPIALMVNWQIVVLVANWLIALMANWQIAVLMANWPIALMANWPIVLLLMANLPINAYVIKTDGGLLIVMFNVYLIMKRD